MKNISLLSLFVCICSFVSFASGVSRSIDNESKSIGCAPLFGSAFYVDTNNPAASDSNTGTIKKPFRTIGKGVRTAKMSGDTVFVRTGVYHEQVKTIWDGSDSVGNIVYMAYPGEHPVIDGTGVNTGNDGVLIQTAYITFRGFEVRNWSGIGIRTTGARSLLICGNEVHEVGKGIMVSNGTHDFMLCTNTVYRFDLCGIDVGSGQWPCSNGLIRLCKTYSGRDKNQKVDGFAFGGNGQANSMFEDCEAWDVYRGFNISATGTILLRCSAHDCWNSGLRLSQSIRAVNCLSHHNEINNVELDRNCRVTLFNCTFYGAGNEGIRTIIFMDSLKMYNCIVAGNKWAGLWLESNAYAAYKGDHNMIHTSSGSPHFVIGNGSVYVLGELWTAYSGQDLHSFTIPSDTVLFVDAAAHNFKLRADSPAIDAGQATGSPPTDFIGSARPLGKQVDIGAYEYAPPVAADNLPHPEELAISVYPNPSRGQVTVSTIGRLQGNVAMHITDVLGRKIRTLTATQIQNGTRIAVWDGKDASSHPVLSGMYFIEAVSGMSVVRKQVMMVR